MVFPPSLSRFSTRRGCLQVGLRSFQLGPGLDTCFLLFWYCLFDRSALLVISITDKPRLARGAANGVRGEVAEFCIEYLDSLDAFVENNGWVVELFFGQGKLLLQFFVFLNDGLRSAIHANHAKGNFQTVASPMPMNQSLVSLVDIFDNLEELY